MQLCLLTIDTAVIRNLFSDKDADTYVRVRVTRMSRDSYLGHLFILLCTTLKAGC